MKRFYAFFLIACWCVNAATAQELEPMDYSENFEQRMLGAWASYPHWQDIAYDQNFRVNEVVPGDKNISMVQKVTPYTAVDNYAGAQKLLEAVLAPGTKLKFRYYIKTNEKAEFLTVRWAADTLGKLNYTIKNPELNKWAWVEMSFEQLAAANPFIGQRKSVPVHALAVLVKVPNADPAMPIYFALDDIHLNAMQPTRLRFQTPVVDRLSEFAPFIATKPYQTGEAISWTATWPAEATKISTEITSYTGKTVLTRANWKKQGAGWQVNLGNWKLVPGLYKARQTVYQNNNITGTTDLVFRVSQAASLSHPRLLFDEAGKQRVEAALKTPAYQAVLDDIVKQAKSTREKIPLESLVFDLDQFPDEDWLPTWASWGSRIYHTGEALRMNARAYAFAQDKEAGEYVRALLVRLSSWPNWTHPWQTKRGRFSEHRTGSWSHRVAEAYDLVYALIPEDERKSIRKAIINNIIEGAHKTYVVDDNITGATSNWLAMTLGGSLMNMAAIEGDGSDTRGLELQIAGAIFKLDKMLNRVVDSVDGAWGEGLGYNNYSMSNLTYSLPSVDRVFNVDLTAPIRNSYKEFLWGGILKKKLWFEYGDSGGDIGPATNWAYLLQKYRDPQLSWYFNFMKKAPTYEEVVFNVKDIPQQSVFDENPVKVFRQVGTTVFKSGWDSTDMVFVMRTGPFYNHQHLDQGSFWFADKGDVFVEERHLHDSHYYDDPIYQSHLIQPIAHSTILIDSNAQSQRTGDHRSFAKGFNDYAYLAEFVDGKAAAFSSGDIGRLYWGKLASLRRNVLYLKPRVLVMMDVAVPNDIDRSVELLYQTKKLSSIVASDSVSQIKGANGSLRIQHLHPAGVESRAIETPHYLKTLNASVPMEKEGMLRVQAHTQGAPLVFTNILSTLAAGEIKTSQDQQKITGSVGGQQFVVNKKPGAPISVTSIFDTDALCVSWGDGSFVVGQVKQFSSAGFSLESTVLMALETDGKTYINYSAEAPGRINIKLASGKMKTYSLEAGEHRLLFK